MNKNDTLKQICKMISSGEIPAETYNYYLSKTPIGFMNYKDLCNYFNLDNKSVNNTAKQLVEQLGNSTEITIMADIVHGLDFEYEQLLQENQKLSSLIANEVMLDYDYDSILKNQLGEERLKYVALEESKNMTENILTELEKFLENRLKDTYANNDMAKGYKNALKISLCKLQKLKEGKK